MKNCTKLVVISWWKMPKFTIFQQYIPAGYQNVTGFLNFTTLLSDLKLIPLVDDWLPVWLHQNWKNKPWYNLRTFRWIWKPKLKIPHTCLQFYNCLQVLMFLPINSNLEILPYSHLNGSFYKFAEYHDDVLYITSFNNPENPIILNFWMLNLVWLSKNFFT